jgi:flagellar biosynthesis/type III secretory pathway protein FliH
MNGRLEVRFAYHEEDMLTAIANRVADQVQAQWRDELSSRIKASITANIDTETREMIRSELRTAVESGWTETNAYGEATGKTLTFKERVSKALNNRDYNNPLADKNISEMVKSLLGEVLKKEVEEARVKFRQQVDDILREKLAAALRNSLGLGV